jgi:peroxiredoxin Q/BCP
MRKLAIVAGFAFALHAQSGKTHLKVGDAAPDFKLASSVGKPFTLSEFKGRKMVVLAFFPAAFTGG